MQANESLVYPRQGPVLHPKATQCKIHDSHSRLQPDHRASSGGFWPRQMSHHLFRFSNSKSEVYGYSSYSINLRQMIKRVMVLLCQSRLTKGAGWFVLWGKDGLAKATSSPVALLPTELVITAKRVLTEALIGSCKHTHRYRCWSQTMISLTEGSQEKCIWVWFNKAGL